jgi:hypothetical protein
MKTKLLLWLAVLSLPGLAPGQFIDLRVSVHVILNPTNGLRPAGITDNVFYTAEANANEWMARYYRGYRFRITEVTNVGGPTQGGASGPSKWFDRDFRDTPEPWNTFQNDTQTDSRYRLRTDAVNFYVATGFASSGGGGACPIPPGDVSFLACQGFANNGPFWLVHETGHFFGLSHTHGGCGCPNPGGCPGQNCPVPDSCFPLNGFFVGDDGIADTLPEAAGDSCFTTQNLIAQANFNKTYANCTAAEQTLVDNTFFNVMSYHNPTIKDQVEDVMTELQLDRHADTASKPAGSGGRLAFSSGRTHFIDTLGSDGGSGRSTSPLRTVGRGVTNSAVGDILLLRPGNYNQTLTINRPVTLRAPRTGWATIGQ